MTLFVHRFDALANLAFGIATKENAMRRKRLARLLRKLRVMRKSLPKRDQLLLRIGAACATMRNFTRISSCTTSAPNIALKGVSPSSVCFTVVSPLAMIVPALCS